jgi:hypothetical protein
MMEGKTGGKTLEKQNKINLKSSKIKSWDPTGRIKARAGVYDQTQ